MVSSGSNTHRDQAERRPRRHRHHHRHHNTHSMQEPDQRQAMYTPQQWQQRQQQQWQVMNVDGGAPRPTQDEPGYSVQTRGYSSSSSSDGDGSQPGSYSEGNSMPHPQNIASGTLTSSPIMSSTSSLPSGDTLESPTEQYCYPQQGSAQDGTLVQCFHDGQIYPTSVSDSGSFASHSSGGSMNQNYESEASSGSRIESAHYNSYGRRRTRRQRLAATIAFATQPTGEIGSDAVLAIMDSYIPAQGQEEYAANHGPIPQDDGGNGGNGVYYLNSAIDNPGDDDRYQPEDEY